jgi:hypothetical protein
MRSWKGNFLIDLQLFLYYYPHHSNNPMSPAKNLMALCNYGPDRQGKDLFFYIRQGIRLPHHYRGHDANRYSGCKSKRVVGAGEPFLLNEQ